jgi:hypothetical protein
MVLVSRPPVWRVSHRTDATLRVEAVRRTGVGQADFSFGHFAVVGGNCLIGLREIGGSLQIGDLD